MITFKGKLLYTYEIIIKENNWALQKYYKKDGFDNLIINIITISYFENLEIQ